MASGNFLIGQSLSWGGFNAYVKPAFEDGGYAVSDVLPVEHRGTETLLVSIVGIGDLESTVNKTLIDVRKTVDEKEKARLRNKYPMRADAEYGDKIAWDHQIAGVDHYEKQEGAKECEPVMKGHYIVLGLYSDGKTASQLFPVIAQKYLLQNVENAISKVGKELNFLAKRLSCQ